MPSMIYYGQFKDRALAVVGAYNKLRASIARQDLPLDPQEAFFDLADAMELNSLVTRLDNAAARGGDPTDQDVEDLWRAEIRLPFLVRAADALRARTDYGTRSQERIFLANLVTRAAGEISGEAQRTERLSPWVYVAITMGISAITWLLVALTKPKKGQEAPFIVV